MKRILIDRGRSWVPLIYLAAAFSCAAGQFVEIRAEIELLQWDYWFFSDRIGRYPGHDAVPSIFRPTEKQVRRCVVGARTWMIESEFSTCHETRWFTGTNIIDHTVITRETPAAELEKIRAHSRLGVGAPPVGHRYTTLHQSLDGNPGRPGGVADLMGFDLPGTISWLAFCSGPALRQEGRQIYPPSAFWKESSISFSGWKDMTEIFPDDLGLPRSINLVSTNQQSIFQYQVRQSTNVLGWTFPLEFYGVQYLPAGTNGWKVHLTVRGRVTSIGPGNEPAIPAIVMETVQR